MPSRSLLDCAPQLLDFIIKIKDQAKDLSGPALFERCKDLFAEFDRAAKGAGHEPEHIKLAQYAFVALLDERVLSAELPSTAEWMTSPLQLRWYDAFNAGEAFFERIDGMTPCSSERHADILECYYAALALGFNGKLAADRSGGARTVLMAKLLREIGSAHPAKRGDDDPTASPGDDNRRSRYPVWLVPVVAALVIIIVMAAAIAHRSSLLAAFDEAITGAL